MKYIFIFLFLIISLNASSQKFIEKMGYEVDYNIALTKAKKEKKILMMIVSTKDCPWCRKLERQTLKKSNINKIIKESFIPLALEKDKGDYPKKFEVKVVPTIFFINPENEATLNKTLGYKNKKDFLEILNKVLKK